MLMYVSNFVPDIFTQGSFTVYREIEISKKIWKISRDLKTPKNTSRSHNRSLATVPSSWGCRMGRSAIRREGIRPRLHNTPPAAPCLQILSSASKSVGNGPSALVERSQGPPVGSAEPEQAPSGHGPDPPSPHPVPPPCAAMIAVTG